MKTFPISLLVILHLCIFCLPIAVGQDQPALEVTDSAICRDVENLECVDPKEEFSANVGRLYCFTRIAGAQVNTEVTHVWYYGDSERARIALAVRSTNYRTYSSKRIQPHETGQWRVEVLDSNGTVLKTIPFSVVQ
jgi:hypothetical protein